jgi:branched-chain amino acid transport system ATP-binding protein
VLEAREVCWGRGGVRLLDRVSLHVAEGTVHAVVGPAGAGKTTLVNLLAGYLAPVGGTIHHRGADITSLGPGGRASLGIVRSFRVTGLLGERSAAEHVELALAAAAHRGNAARGLLRRSDVLARALDLLDEVGLVHRAGTPVEALRLVDRRALEVALALAHRPEVLLLDEPTAGLGASETMAIAALLGRVAATRALVLVEHHQGVVDALADTLTRLPSRRRLDPHAA